MLITFIFNVIYFIVKFLTVDLQVFWKFTHWLWWACTSPVPAHPWWTPSLKSDLLPFLSPPEESNQWGSSSAVPLLAGVSETPFLLFPPGSHTPHFQRRCSAALSWRLLSSAATWELYHTAGPIVSKQEQRVLGQVKQSPSPPPAFWNPEVGGSGQVRVSRASGHAAPLLPDTWVLTALYSSEKAMMSRANRSLPGTVTVPNAPASSMCPVLSAPYWAPLRGSCFKRILTPELQCVVFALGPHGKFLPVICLRARPSAS